MRSENTVKELWLRVEKLLEECSPEDLEPWRKRVAELDNTPWWNKEYYAFTLAELLEALEERGCEEYKKTAKVLQELTPQPK